MVKSNIFVVIALITMAILIAVVGYLASDDAGSSSSRWYSTAQVEAGEKAFIGNCLVCHGERGRSTANWQQKLPDGSFPPPPLNGTAHTWHHPLAALRQTIRHGGAPVGGNMPAFAGKLSDEEIDQVIAYFQSQWPDKIYQLWAERVNNR